MELQGEGDSPQVCSSCLPMVSGTTSSINTEGEGVQDAACTSCVHRSTPSLLVTTAVCLIFSNSMKLFVCASSGKPTESHAGGLSRCCAHSMTWSTGMSSVMLQSHPSNPAPDLLFSMSSPPPPASFRIHKEDSASWSGNWDVKKRLEFSESLYHVVFFGPFQNDLVFDCSSV